MSNRRAIPLLRAAALSATLAACRSSTVTPPAPVEPSVTEPTPVPDRVVQPTEPGVTRVEIDGSVQFMGDEPRTVTLLVSDGQGGGGSITLERGPSPRPFHVRDTDFATTPLKGEHVTLTATAVGATPADLAVSDATTAPTVQTGLSIMAWRPQDRAPERPVYANTKGSMYDKGPPQP